MNDPCVLYEDILQGKRVEPEQAIGLFHDNAIPLSDLMYFAGRIRAHFFQDRVHLCAIINAKSGGCSEDCAFCSQSARHSTSVQIYPFMSVEQCMEAAKKAESYGVRCFSLVASGKSLKNHGEKEKIKSILRAIKDTTRLQVAASLGTCTPDDLRVLKDAGLDTYHHNLETAPSFYPEICTTHPIAERIATVKAAMDSGLTVCAGGIFGMGEDATQRAEFSLLLRDLCVHRIPVNFLDPIPGTRLQSQARLEPLGCLRILAALRFILPDRDIIVCGGRGVTLRSLQPLLFLAGANGVMTGDYLTTRGQEPEVDLAMIRDLQLHTVR